MYASQQEGNTGIFHVQT